MMDTSVRPAGDVLVVTGVLDAESVLGLQASGAEWIMGDAPVHFTLDMAGVKYSSSAGLALLLDWLRTAAASGKQARIAHMPADMQALVHVSGLENLLPMA